jgi:2-hydroxy-6-oxonona-2,4-dienedioate hydrolase
MLPIEPSSAPALMLLHGMFGRPADWEPVGKALEAEWRVFIPRLPVFDFPDGQCGLRSLCDRVRDILDSNGVKRVVLGGNSLGGHVALLLALHMPERVSGLVLTGSSGLFEHQLEGGFDRGVPRRPSREWIYDRVREVFYDEVHVTDDLIDEVAETVSRRRTVVNVVRLARAVRRSNLRDQLRSITCPVTLIWGTEDRITPPRVAHEFARHLPNASIHFLDRCGHTPPIERPEQFTGIVRPALEGIVASR